MAISMSLLGCPTTLHTNSQWLTYAGSNGNRIRLSSNLPGHMHEYPPLSSFGMFSMRVQSHKSQLTLQPNHLTNSGNIPAGAGGGSESHQVLILPTCTLSLQRWGAPHLPSGEEYEWW